MPPPMPPPISPPMPPPPMPPLQIPPQDAPTTPRDATTWDAPKRGLDWDTSNQLPTKGVVRPLYCILYIV